MTRTAVVVHAIGDTAAVTLPERGEFDPKLDSPKYLRIELERDSSRAGVFEVARNPRAGAEGIEIHVQPGQLQLSVDDSRNAWAEPVSVWAYRWAQLGTPTGRLVLGTLAAATTAAWIDGSLAVGKLVADPIQLEPATLAVLGFVSMACKLASAVFAFLLALWFKK